MKLMRSMPRSRNPFRVAYFVLLFLLASGLALVLTLNVQKATASNLAAQTALGTAFTYQGHLNDGSNPANGAYDFQFTLFDAETGGAAVGVPVAVPNVNVQQGVFTVKLDFGASAFTGAPRWLEIKVGAAGSNNLSKLDPRQAISPAPYAIYAENAGNANSAINATTAVNATKAISATNATNATNAASVPWAGITGKPAIGAITTIAAGPGLSGGGNSGDVTLAVDYANVAQNHTHLNQRWTTSGNVGLAITSTATSGSGVWGNASSASGLNSGIEGSSNSSNGNGVYGHNESQNVGANDVPVGMWGTNQAPGGGGVEGDNFATSGEGYGVGGFTYSSNGKGVYGKNKATTLAASDFAYGVRGDAVATSGQAHGVLGYSHSKDGVGVYGWNDNNGWAGYFLGKTLLNGPTEIRGSLAKPAGSFKIDHPLDPAKKYLYHSFVESPDMMNIYNGNVVLDAQGGALVQMPAWFEALNMEFRYQLTPIGAPGPNLYIAQEITNNQFKIAGGAANMKVSWQVTGIRHDPYAQAHRIPVEEDKPVGEQGTYLYPTEYGQAAARGQAIQPTTPQTVDAPSKSITTQAGTQQVQPTENH